MLKSVWQLFRLNKGELVSQNSGWKPISREEFRVQLRNTFILHGAVFGPGLLISILANRLQLPELQILTMALLVVMVVVIDFFFWKQPNYNGRLLDIYPEITLRTKMLAYMLLYCPVSSVAFILFLSFKDRNSNGRPPFLLGRGRKFLYGLLAIPLFGPFLWSGLVMQGKVEIEGIRKISYWISSPTGDELIWISDQVLAAKRLESALSASTVENVNNTFRKFNDETNLNGVGALLALAHSVTRNYPKNKETTSQEKQKMMINILLDLKCIIDHNFHSSHLGRINPLMLLNPYTAYEAVFIGLVNSILDYNFARKVIRSTEGLIENTEKNSSELILLETTKIRDELDKHRIYKRFKEDLEKVKTEVR